MGGHHSGGLFGITSGSNLPEPLFKVMQNGEYKIYGKSDLSSSKLIKMTKAQLLQISRTEQCRQIIEELYRDGATVGDGGCADAIRQQLISGKLVGNKDHIKKGKERLRQIKKILAKDENHPDKDILEFLASDLEQALGGN